MPSLTVLSGSAPLQNSENCTSSQQNNRWRIFWGRIPTPRSRSPSCNVKQAVDALRMQHCNRTLHASILTSVIPQVRTVIPPNEGIVCEIQSSHHSLMDENVMGKAIIVWGSRRVCWYPPLLSMKWGSIPHEDTVKSRVQWWCTPTPKQSTCISTGPVLMTYLQLLEEKLTPRSSHLGHNMKHGHQCAGQSSNQRTWIYNYGKTP